MAVRLGKLSVMKKNTRRWKIENWTLQQYRSKKKTDKRRIRREDE